jgi:DNA-directed RNA polymerase specialized sigma24 family protein
MAMQPPSQPIERKPKKELRRWNYDEETRLIHLIETEDKTYAEAAEILSRSLPAVQQRYSLIRQRDVNATITWTPELDAAVIDGQRRRLSSRQIGLEIGLPEKAVQSRWQALKAMKRVPEDVLNPLRRKQVRDFSPEEDEAILRLYVEGKEDKEIAWMLKIKGKSQTEVIRRRQKLVSESSPIYRRLVSMHHGQSDKDGSEKEMDALGMAMGGEKYKWMEEEKQGR